MPEAFQLIHLINLKAFHSLVSIQVQKKAEKNHEGTQLKGNKIQWADMGRKKKQQKKSQENLFLSNCVLGWDGMTGERLTNSFDRRSNPVESQLSEPERKKEKC